MQPKHSMLEMLKAGVHFGHQTSRWHPSMEPFIFASREGIHVIDLEKTQEKLAEALDFIGELVKKGDKILLVGTKRQAKEPIKKLAQKTDMPYVVERWLGGTFTNFSSVRKQTDKLAEMAGEDEKELRKYTKKERLVRGRNLEKLKRDFAGILNMKRLPGAVFLVGSNDEKLAIAEARKKNIPVIALVDTNADVQQADYPIPSNDDAIKAIDLMCDEVLGAIMAGQKKD